MKFVFKSLQLMDDENWNRDTIGNRYYWIPLESIDEEIDYLVGIYLYNSCL